uniref:PWI domain-containing protein n=1 Tax=Rhizochromulina marina TaxID=1034831 RepID=A0A7S2SU80_9STRA
MSSGFFRGTSVDQDSRWGNTNKRLMKKMKFAAVLGTKVDTGKVNLPVMNRWITERLTQLLGFEDEIVIGLVINFLEANKHPAPKQLQLDVTGFLEKKAGQFVEELWTLLAAAQENKNGIPPQFIEKKKEELAVAQSRSGRKSRFSVQDERTVKAMAEVQRVVAAATAVLPRPSLPVSSAVQETRPEQQKAVEQERKTEDEPKQELRDEGGRGDREGRDRDRERRDRDRDRDHRDRSDRHRRDRDRDHYHHRRRDDDRDRDRHRDRDRDRDRDRRRRERRSGSRDRDGDRHRDAGRRRDRSRSRDRN